MEEVGSVLKSLPVGKAVGPDGINALAINREISPVLCGFFNQSLRTDMVPGSFKQAYVTPVQKGGDLSDISNYRPTVKQSGQGFLTTYLYNHFLDNTLTCFQS